METMEVDPANAPKEVKSEKQEETIQFIGDRNAVIFRAGTGEPLPSLELPDDFFELTKEDAVRLFKEFKQNREDLENQPLRTQALRELEENTAALSHLARYSRTVLRVQFPDHLVLQAVFNHSDTVHTVSQFLRPLLEPPDVQFYLYTAPPKSVLSPDVTLLDAKLTPRAVVYFGAAAAQDQKRFLKPSLTHSLTSPRLASEAALQYRKEEQEDVKAERNVPDEAPSSSVNQNLPSTSKKSSLNSKKVPKWFKQ